MGGRISWGARQWQETHGRKATGWPKRLAPERALPNMLRQPNATPSQLDERKPGRLNRRLSTAAVPISSLTNFRPATVLELRLQTLPVHTPIVQSVGFAPRRLVEGQTDSVFDDGTKRRSLFGGQRFGAPRELIVNVYGRFHDMGAHIFQYGLPYHHGFNAAVFPHSLPTDTAGFPPGRGLVEP